MTDGTPTATWKELSAFYLTGIAHPVAEGDLRDALVARFIAERHTLTLTPAALDEQQPFESTSRHAW